MAVRTKFPDGISSFVVYNTKGDPPFRVTITSDDYKLQVSDTGEDIKSAYDKALGKFRKERPI